MEENKTFAADDFTLAQKNEILLDKTYKQSSFFRDVVDSFRKNKGAFIALIIVAIIIFFAIFGPGMNEHTYKSQEMMHQNLPPRIPFLENFGIFNGTLRGVNVYASKGLDDVYYWFGTDSLGRDIWTRVWMGTRISLLIAVVAVAIDICIGMVYGLISGYFGGKVDMIMQRIAEILNGIPTLVIVTLLVLVLEPGITSIIVALMITGWIGMSRVSRAQVLKLKEQEYILASRTLGEGQMAIVFKDILPNIFGQIIIMSMFSIPNAIFTEAYLAFVGLGLPAPLASLGVLVNDGYKTITLYPFQIFSAIIVLGILMLSFNLLADGIRDAFDPQMKQM